MLAAHTHCIPKFTLIQVVSCYLSASSTGICLFGMSHLFPVMMMGVSCGRYICSSLTHFETLLHDSRSVMSYTINAPKLDIKSMLNGGRRYENLIIELHRRFTESNAPRMSYHVLLNNRLYLEHDNALIRRCPKSRAVPWVPVRAKLPD